MKRNDVFPSRFLKADDLQERDLTVTIKDCEMVEFTDPQTRERDDKPVLYFQEQGVKPLILNKTNFSTIEKVLGSDETEDWKGKKITLFGIEVEAFGNITLTIRVRQKPKNSNAAQLQPIPEEDKLPWDK